jgi:OFA family oxalate/formate antiporter-like MFS transporter
MTLTYGIVAAVGNSFCYATTMPSGVKWFPPEKKGLVTGIIVGCVGLAAAYVSPIANWLVAGHGIAGTFLVLGVAILIIDSSLAQCLRVPSTPDAAGPDGAGAAADTIPKEYEWQEMIRTPQFYKLWLIYVCTASAGLMVIGHIASIAKTQAGWENGFYLVMVLAFFNTAGRLGAGYFSDRYGRIVIMAAVILLQAVNMLLFNAYATPPTLALGTAVAGLCYGASFALFPLATGDFYGLRNLGVNYGLMFTAWGVAGVFGPLMGGWAADATGSYQSAYLVFAALLLIALVLALTLRRQASPA